MHYIFFFFQIPKSTSLHEALWNEDSSRFGCFKALLIIISHHQCSDLCIFFAIMGCLWAGADVNLKNDGGRTALHYAASKGWLKIVELLISRGAKINSKDKACSFLYQ